MKKGESAALQGLVVLVFVFLATLVGAALISSSKITDCVLRGGESAEEAALSCDKKMIVALTLEGGQVVPLLPLLPLLLGSEPLLFQHL